MTTKTSTIIPTLSTDDLSRVIGGVNKLSMEESIKKFGPEKRFADGNLMGCDAYAPEDARSCF